MTQCLECSNNNCWVAIRLVDEMGEGSPYANLAYLLTDCTGTVHNGVLDANGYVKHENIPCGGVILSFGEKYQGSDTFYLSLLSRDNYPLPITQLQYAAEQTQWVDANQQLLLNRYRHPQYFHPKRHVSDLVEHKAHLPQQMFGRAGINGDYEFRLAKQIRGCIPAEKRAQVPQYGMGLQTNYEHVIQLKALRAYRPKLSLSNDFSMLNLYQLAILAAMSYKDFGSQTTRYDLEDMQKFYGHCRYDESRSSIAYTLAHEWANHQESGYYGKAEYNQPYPMFLEDVPYSKRFEVVPFDPDLYDQNSWQRDPSLIPTTTKPLVWNVEGRQETPDSVHFFDDSMLGYFGKEGTHTQGFLTHSDEVLIVSVRGTQEIEDFITDAKAPQVTIQNYNYRARAHLGFHSAYTAIRPFIESYLNRFHTGQKIIVVGHSLGGAIATLVAEWIRQQNKYTGGNNNKVILYTYGSPRVGDEGFLIHSQIKHYRLVAENDPIPSVPGTFLSNETQATIIAGGTGFILTRIFDDNSTSRYSHQGELRHFTNLSLNNPRLVSDQIMWQPGCQSVQVCTDALALNAQLPSRPHFGRQILSMSDHFMFTSYIPFAHTTLLRWKRSLDSGNPIVSSQEIAPLRTRLNTYRQELHKLTELSFSNLFDASLNTIPILGTKRMYDRATTISQLNDEIERLEADIQRANTLTTQVITKNEFYGSDLANDTAINIIYNNWHNKDQNCQRPTTIEGIQK